MRLFKKAAIIGTGLIGGSLGLVLKRKKLAAKVVGVSRRKSSIILARKNGAIDCGSQGLGIIKDSDLVVLATPVDVILSLAPKIKKLVGKDCIITDVGSTKKEIVSRLEKIFPNYIGSHPLAGSEKRSMAFAHVDLFRGSLCLLTPTKNTDPKAIAKVKKIWQLSGARVVFLDASLHDRILSSVSHLPHAVAFSLIRNAPAGYLKFASGGLKDTTRIAASAPELWADIFLTNRKNLLRDITSFEGKLAGIKSALKGKNKKKLSAILKEAKAKRERLG